MGCLEKDSRGICLNCASDYYLTEGICKNAIRNCKTYTDNKKTICTECSYGYSLISNLCVQNSVLGCKNEVSHICQECYKPFTLANGNCDITNCKTYNEYKCVACHCGYFLTFDGTCKANEVGCVRYQRSQCTDCLPGFLLKGSKCDKEGCLDLNGIKCKKCGPKYELIEGSCQMKNCLSWKDGSCDICKPGFNYQEGLCVGVTPIVNQQ